MAYRDLPLVFSFGDEQVEESVDTLALLWAEFDMAVVGQGEQQVPDVPVLVDAPMPKPEPLPTPMRVPVPARAPTRAPVRVPVPSCAPVRAPELYSTDDWLAWVFATQEHFPNNSTHSHEF